MGFFSDWKKEYNNSLNYYREESKKAKENPPKGFIKEVFGQKPDYLRHKREMEEQNKKPEAKSSAKAGSSKMLTLDELKEHSRNQKNNSCIVTFHSKEGTFRLVVASTKGNRYLPQNIQTLISEMTGSDFFQLGLNRFRLTEAFNYYFGAKNNDLCWMVAKSAEISSRRLLCLYESRVNLRFYF